MSFSYNLLSLFLHKPLSLQFLFVIVITPLVSMFIGQGLSLDACCAAQAERWATNAAVVAQPAAEWPLSVALPPPVLLVLSPSRQTSHLQGELLDLGGGRRRLASAKIRCLRRGRVVGDNNDTQSGAPLETGDIPSRSFVVDDGSGTGLEDLVALSTKHPKGGEGLTRRRTGGVGGWRDGVDNDNERRGWRGVGWCAWRNRRLPSPTRINLEEP